jgi:AcrR family transcriptional regulator
MPSVTRGRSEHRARRADARARIVAATERLLRDGERFTEIPVERLLTEADVSRSTFYVHFADKSALLATVAEHSLGEVLSAAEGWWQADHRKGPDVAAATVLELIKLYRKHAAVLRTVVEVGAYDDEIRDLWRGRREAFASGAARGLRIEQQEGLIAADVDVEASASVVVQMVETAVLDHIASGSPRKDRKLAETLARIGWLAYYGRVPPDGA